MLVFPQTPGLRIESQSFLTARSISPDLGESARSSYERIVRRRSAVAGDMQDLAEVIIEPLCNIPRRGIGPVADRQEQTAVGRDRDPSSGFRAKPLGRNSRLRAKDDL